MVNMSAKFDKEICNGLVAIVFTRSTDGRTDRRTHTHTHGTTAALLYPHRNALRGDNKLVKTGSREMELSIIINTFEKNGHYSFI